MRGASRAEPRVIQLNEAARARAHESHRGVRGGGGGGLLMRRQFCAGAKEEQQKENESQRERVDDVYTTKILEDPSQQYKRGLQGSGAQAL